MAGQRVGIWLIGAWGGVGSSVALGLAALRRNLIPNIGLVSALPEFARLRLDNPTELVLGGHDVRAGAFAASARSVGGLLPAYSSDLIDACTDELNNWSTDVMVATKIPTPDELREHFRRFASKHRLDQLVVVNVATSEPDPTDRSEHHDLASLLNAKQVGDWSALPESGWHAFAAIDGGFPYVNFTASRGCAFPSLLAWAEKKRTPVAGNDGKTGETLLKSTLAPMFRARNLKILSWIAHNLLGNRDGESLCHSERKTSKIRSKNRVSEQFLDADSHYSTEIEYVPSLDDWKTAWDLVHFQGFLNVPMTLQLTWQGCDSALAAPLVIDLSRLLLLAQRRGDFGPMTHLSAFFKSPIGVEEHDFSQQMAILREYAQRIT